jgi:hypothetical protein
MPRSKLKHLQAGGRALVLEVHWDNHSWMSIRRALDPNAPAYSKDQWKKIGPIVSHVSKFIRQHYMQRRPDGSLTSILPYSMAVAVDSIAIMLKSDADLRITDEMIEGLKNHRPIGNTPPWSELELWEGVKHQIMDPRTIKRETEKCHQMLFSKKGRSTPYVMTMFGRKDWDCETPNQDLERRVKIEGLVVYEPNEKEQDDRNSQGSNRNKNEKMARIGESHKKWKNHPSSGTKRRRKKREGEARRAATPAGSSDQRRSGDQSGSDRSRSEGRSKKEPRSETPGEKGMGAKTSGGPGDRKVGSEVVRLSAGWSSITKHPADCSRDEAEIALRGFQHWRTHDGQGKAATMFPEGVPRFGRGVCDWFYVQVRRGRLDREPVMVWIGEKSKKEMIVTFWAGSYA